MILELGSPGAEQRELDYYIHNQAHLERWEPRRSPEFLTLTWWRHQLESNVREFHEDRGARMVLWLKSDPTQSIVGVANLANIVRGAFQACHLGYSIDARHEGRGLMREGLEALIEYSFGELGLHRVMANYQPDNLRSGALLKRLGFVEEGYARDYLHINGAWRDHVLTSLVRDEERR